MVRSITRRDVFPGLCVAIAIGSAVFWSWWLAAAWIVLAVACDMAYQLSRSEAGADKKQPPPDAERHGPDWDQFSRDVAAGRRPGRNRYRDQPEDSLHD